MRSRNIRPTGGWHCWCAATGCGLLTTERGSLNEEHPAVATGGANDGSFFKCGIGLPKRSASAVNLPASHVFAGLKARDYRCILIDAPDRVSSFSPGKRVRVGMFGAMKSPNFHG